MALEDTGLLLDQRGLDLVKVLVSRAPTMKMSRSGVSRLLLSLSGVREAI